MKNKNKGIIALIVILSLLVIGLGSYIVYDKFIAKTDTNKKKNNENVANNEEKKESNITYQLDSSRQNQEFTFTITIEDSFREFGSIKLGNNTYNLSYEDDVLKIGTKEIFINHGRVGLYILPNTLLIRLINPCEKMKIIQLDFNLNIKYEKDNYFNVDDQFVNWQEGLITFYEISDTYDEAFCSQLIKQQIQFDFNNSSVSEPSFIEIGEEAFCNHCQMD